MLKKLWYDCDGGIITTELLLVSSVLVAALLTGLTALKNSITAEFESLGHKVRNVQAATVEQPVVSEKIQNVPEVYFPEELIIGR